MRQVLTRSAVRPADDIKNQNRRVTFKDDVKKKLEKHDNIGDKLKHHAPSTTNDDENKKKTLDDEADANDDNNLVETDATDEDPPNLEERIHAELPDKESVDESISSRTRSKKRIVGALNTQTARDIGTKTNNSSIMTMLTVPTALLFILIQFAFWVPNVSGNPVPNITESKQFQKAFANGNNAFWNQMKCIHACDKTADEVENIWNDETFVDRSLWNAKQVTSHRMKNGNVEAKVDWDDVNKSSSWVDMSSLAFQDPIPILKHAKAKHLLAQKPFSMIANYCVGDAPSAMAKAFKAKMVTHRKKCKFGVRVPFGVKRATMLDKENGNTLWLDAIKKELKCLNDWKVFWILEKGEKAPQGHKEIPCHIAFDVKFDLCHRARPVASGDWNILEHDEVCSGVVGTETVQMGFSLGEMNDLKCCAGDVSSACLHGMTREKVHFVAGPEFGEFEGQISIVCKSICGLLSSGAQWHEVMSDKLCQMGFKPSPADSDMWTKDMGDHHASMATCVDNLIVWAKDVTTLMNEIKEDFDLKNVGPPEHCLEGNVDCMDEHWTKENMNPSFSAKTHIANLIPKFELCLNHHFETVKSPMAPECHLEVDDSPLPSDEDASEFRSVIGSLNWLITLGRFDVHCATNALSRFGMAPREGHMKAALRVLTHVKTFPKGKIVFDTSCPVHKQSEGDDHNWTEFHPDAKEESPPDMPEPKGKPVRITVHLDADHAHDLVTRRSVTRILVFLNNAPIRWTCQRQKTVETSTHGSKLVAVRAAAEMVMELRHQLQMLGVPVDGPAMMFGDNQSVVLNTTVPSGILKKKHHACACHHMREAIAAKIIVFKHMKSSENHADVMTKPLAADAFWSLVKPHLFRNPKWFENIDENNKNLE